MPRILDDSSFYPPSRPFTSRYLKTSATWPPRRHRQVKGTCRRLSLGRVPSLHRRGRGPRSTLTRCCVASSACFQLPGEDRFHSDSLRPWSDWVEGSGFEESPSSWIQYCRGAVVQVRVAVGRPPPTLSHLSSRSPGGVEEHRVPCGAFRRRGALVSGPQGGCRGRRARRACFLCRPLQCRQASLPGPAHIAEDSQTRGRWPPEGLPWGGHVLVGACLP